MSRRWPKATWSALGGRVRLYRGDSLELLPAFPRGRIASVVTDPPYGLGFMGKEFDKLGRGARMQEWHQVWAAEALRVAKPGAFLLAFGGTRTYHRLTCGIEDAGWEIRDCVMWLYGQGLPKSHDISKAIDKAAGAQREDLGRHPNWRETKRDNGQSMNPVPNEARITLPATDAAALWSGWGTALKPAWEPIVPAMKPLDGTFAHNALEHGVAGLNIDGCRVGAEERTYKGSGASRIKLANHGPGDTGIGYMDGSGKELTFTATGRWPTNVILSHHPECVLRGTKRVKGDGNFPSQQNTASWKMSSKGKSLTPDVSHADADGLETVEDWDCHTDCPVGMFPSPHGAGRARGGGLGTDGRKSLYSANGPTNGTRIGDSGSAARFFYCAKASRSERSANGQVENRHPTVKPLALMRWLARLTKTPSGGCVLDPFMGSGTTGVACLLEGRRFVGIEKDPESFRVACERIKAAKVEAETEIPLFANDES